MGDKSPLSSNRVQGRGQSQSNSTAVPSPSPPPPTFCSLCPLSSYLLSSMALAPALDGFPQVALNTRKLHPLPAVSSSAPLVLGHCCMAGQDPHFHVLHDPEGNEVRATSDNKQQGRKRGKKAETVESRGWGKWHRLWGMGAEAAGSRGCGDRCQGRSPFLRYCSLANQSLSSLDLSILNFIQLISDYFSNLSRSL